MPDSDAASVLDDETTAALTLYNEYVDADRERTRREKRIRKAERAKDDAAATVKRLADKGSADEKTEAEKAYREANDAWRKLRDGEEPDPPAKEAPAAEEAPADDEAAAEEAPADDEAAAEEAPAEEEAPADEAPADDEAAAEEAPAEEEAPADEAPADEAPAGEDAAPVADDSGEEE